MMHIQLSTKVVRFGNNRNFNALALSASNSYLNSFLLKFYISFAMERSTTIQICASVCSTISCMIVLITTILLLHQKRRSSGADITELHVIFTMIMSYTFSYTILYSTFEPIRSGIGASYMAYVQNPQCFLNTYPLIYHRLHRLSSSATTHI
jgi:hypothetical protein